MLFLSSDLSVSIDIVRLCEDRPAIFKEIALDCRLLLPEVREQFDSLFELRVDPFAELLLVFGAETLITDGLELVAVVAFDLVEFAELLAFLVLGAEAGAGDFAEDGVFEGLVGAEQGHAVLDHWAAININIGRTTVGMRIFGINSQNKFIAYSVFYRPCKNHFFTQASQFCLSPNHRTSNWLRGSDWSRKGSG